MVTRRPYKDQFGKVSVHKLKMKKRRKAGEKGTKWQHSGRKSRNWRRSCNEEGWKEAPCSWRSCKRYESL